MGAWNKEPALLADLTNPFSVMLSRRVIWLLAVLLLNSCHPFEFSSES